MSGRGPGIVVAVYADGTPAVAGADNPLKARDAIVMVAPVKVLVGGLEAQVFFAGLTPGFTGLYQVNAVVPHGAVAGDAVPLVLQQSGRGSPAVSVAVR